MTTPIWFGGTPDPAAITARGAGNLAGLLDIRFTAAGPDWLEATMPVGPRTRQPFGMLHGGASVVLAETAASIGGECTLDPAVARPVGMEINANHVRPVADGLVTARAIAEARGRRSQIWTVRIADPAGRLVCLARVTLAIIDIATDRHGAASRE